MASCTALKENVLINYQIIPIRWSIRLCGENLRGPAVSFEKRRKTYPHESFSASHTKEIFILPVRHQWMQFLGTNLRSECSCFKEMSRGWIAHKSAGRTMYSQHTVASMVDGECVCVSGGWGGGGAILCSEWTVSLPAPWPLWSSQPLALTLLTCSWPLLPDYQCQSIVDRPQTRDHLCQIYWPFMPIEPILKERKRRLCLVIVI